MLERLATITVLLRLPHRVDSRIPSKKALADIPAVTARRARVPPRALSVARQTLLGSVYAGSALAGNNCRFGLTRHWNKAEMRLEASGGCILGMHDDCGYGQYRARLNHLPAGIGKQNRAQAFALKFSNCSAEASA